MDESSDQPVVGSDVDRWARLRRNQSRVDYGAPEVQAVLNMTLDELVDDANNGPGDRIALLLEIADEEGLS
ncbi:hypothetical protein [Amycolatopsis sp. NPDC059021]|uniref:hypothetical protein n=1 Tax=Amycolatopsis sp. NPDC059021 TaxID=3346704 RepID=UPI003671BB2C